MGSRIRANLIQVVPSHQGKIEFGGPCGDRTHDLGIKSSNQRADSVVPSTSYETI